MVEVGDAIIITIGDNTITTEPEAVVGIPSKVTISKVSHIDREVIIANTPNLHNIMTNNPDRPNHNRQPTYVSYVTIKVILITNANSQVILWLELSKLLTKADNTTTKMDKVNGLKGITIMKTLMTSFFSRGGSRCH